MSNAMGDAMNRRTTQTHGRAAADRALTRLDAVWSTVLILESERAGVLLLVLSHLNTNETCGVLRSDHTKLRGRLPDSWHPSRVEPSVSVSQGS